MAPAALGGDAATELAFRRSLRAARARRDVAAATRRWSLRRRATVALAAVAATGFAGAAVAQSPTSAGSSPAGRATLKAGAHGAGVRALQRKLGLPADGVYGARTRRAVRRFQRAHGLAVDGVAGPATLRALGLGGPSAPAPAGAASAAGAATAVARDASAGSGTLDRIAQCESGGDPTAVSATGQYRGKYQFDRATWRALGGHGDPARASESEQDRRAAALLARRGTAPWPTCG